jgi:cysteine dioxygenase
MLQEGGGVEQGRSAEQKHLSRRLVGRPGLISLLAQWDCLGKAIPSDEIRLGLTMLSLDRDALLGCVHFHERAYQRNLIHFTEAYEVLVICWRSGQRSPIHDHGESTCGVLVVEGVATETIFATNQKKGLNEAQSLRIEAGSVIVSRGGDIHQVSNLESAGTDLITLHVYSPRLHGNRHYRIDEKEKQMGPHALTMYSGTIVAPLRFGIVVNRDVVDPQLGG